MSAPQKNAIKSRKQILGQYEVLSQFASEAELSKYCSMEIKYCGYDPTAKLRSIYAANTLAKLQKNGYTKEELKLMNEPKKIMGDDSIKLTATAVRVPVVGGHSEASTMPNRPLVPAPI